MRRRWWIRFGLVLLFAWACRLGYRLYTGRIPLTNLPVVVIPPEEEGQILSSQVWPPEGPEARPFFRPLASPNGRYVIELREWANRSVLLFREGSSRKRVVGFYMFKRLLVYKWTEDSRGVYLADYIPGGDTLLWDVGPVFPPAYRSVIKKVLVPCESVYEAPWWQWQRWYWTLRCLFPDPFHPVAVWVPLLVLGAGLGGVGWAGYWAWRQPEVVRLRQRVREALGRRRLAPERRKPLGRIISVKKPCQRILPQPSNPASSGRGCAAREPGPQKARHPSPTGSLAGHHPALTFMLGGLF